MQRYPKSLSAFDSPLRTGVCPVHIAAGNGDTLTLEVLLSKGADVNVKVWCRLPPTPRSAHLYAAGLIPLI
jgi:ankyrin repeat protein